jgi:RecB family exonuclease
MGKPLGLKQVVPRRNPEPAVIKKVTPSDFRPEKLSPTALGDLFGCPFKWLVQTLGIAPSDGLSFSNDSTMIGTLAHQVLEDVFRTEPVPSEDEARKRAIESFDARLPEMAADLLTPERLADRNDIRARIIEAASDLSRIFKEAGFGRFECERRVETQLDGISVNGQADVIAYDGGGQGHIIDYKYSFSSYYRKKIEQGTDVQLITYARMLGKKQTPVAYYLVPKREMVTMFPDFGVPTVKTEVSVEEGWNRVRKTYGSALKSIREGDVLATGLLEKEACKKLESEKRKEGEIYLDPPCRFCDFGALCGLNVGGAENG